MVAVKSLEGIEERKGGGELGLTKQSKLFQGVSCRRADEGSVVTGGVGAALANRTFLGWWGSAASAAGRFKGADGAEEPKFTF